MFGPEWKEGCPSCSFLSDHIDGTLAHLNHHDVTLLAISRAPLPKIEAFKKRMGWRFPWVSSHDSDFNFDYHVSATKDELAKGEMYYNYRMFKSRGEEQPGISVFYKDEGDGSIYHTYSSYARGGDLLIGTYNYGAACLGKPGSEDGKVGGDTGQIGAAVRGQRLLAVKQWGETVRRITSGSPA